MKELTIALIQNMKDQQGLQIFSNVKTDKNKWLS